MPPQYLSDEQIRRAHRLYMEGVTYDELVAEFHADRTVLRRHFHRLGLPLRGQPAPERLRTRNRQTIRAMPSGPYGLYIRSLLEELDR